jgi:colicin import membrane protein
MNAATLGRPYEVPRTGGSGRAIVLAIVMHALLGALLFFGVHWQSSPPETIQAELWSALPQTAAPPPQPVPPPPKVEAPTPQPPPQPDPEPPVPKADIVEKAPPKVEPPKKKEPVKVDEVKPIAKEQPKPQPPAPKVEPKVNPELLKLQKQAAVEAPVRPPSELSSLLAAAGKEGKDPQTSGPRGSDSYKAKLIAAIRSQMRYPGTSAGNPFVSVRIEQLPNGEVVNVTIVKSSGVPAFDQAVERAVRAASPLPRDERGQVERVLTPDYYMYDK